MICVTHSVCMMNLAVFLFFVFVFEGILGRKVSKGILWHLKCLPKKFTKCFHIIFYRKPPVDNYLFKVINRNTHQNHVGNRFKVSNKDNRKNYILTGVPTNKYQLCTGNCFCFKMGSFSVSPSY